MWKLPGRGLWSMKTSFLLPFIAFLEFASMACCRFPSGGQISELSILLWPPFNVLALFDDGDDGILISKTSLCGRFCSRALAKWHLTPSALSRNSESLPHIRICIPGVGGLSASTSNADSILMLQVVSSKHPYHCYQSSADVCRQMLSVQDPEKGRVETGIIRIRWTGFFCCFVNVDAMSDRINWSLWRKLHTN